MEYILSQKEYDALTPVKRLQERNEALEVAMEIILRLSGYQCGQKYCDGCPISSFGTANDGTKESRPTHKQSKHICIRSRMYGK
jgi:hypothetical protein